jgi:hypothetical protein
MDYFTFTFRPAEEGTAMCYVGSTSAGDARGAKRPRQLFVFDSKRDSPPLGRQCLELELTLGEY